MHQKEKDVKRARTATAGNKQLNFSVKKKTQTTDYVFHIRRIFYD